MLILHRPHIRIPAQLIVHVLSSALPVMYLFYLDEGYYSFAWMREPGAWIVFSVYTMFYLGMQFLVKKLLSKNISSWGQTLLSSILTSFFLTIFLLLIFKG